MRLLGTPIQICLALAITTRLIMANEDDELVVKGDSNLRCTREENHLTCQATYEYDIYTLCKPNVPSPPRDCHDIFQSGSSDSGVYMITPTGSPGAIGVYCEMSDGDGWTVFQRRNVDIKQEDFYRNWEDYKSGFGTLTGEHWLGNENLYYLTNQRTYELRIDLVDKDGNSIDLNYDLFRINDEAKQYKLAILGDFAGNTDNDYMEFHRNMKFSTHDADNDENGNYNCAEGFLGGWWYNRCFDANLNGDTSRTGSKGVCLYNRSKSRYLYQLRYTEMKVRPVHLWSP